MRDPSPRMAALAISALLCLSVLSALEVRSAGATQSGYLNFAVMDQRVSYGIMSYDTQQVQDADLNMLVSTGASCVRTDIGFAPWLTPTDPATQTLIGTVVSQIRSDNECLIIADASSETYRTDPIPWAQFETAWVQRVQTLAQTYQPEYYIVVDEPTWYLPMISDANTNPLVSNVTEWVDLTQQLIATVLAVSPNTKIGVSVDAGGLGTPHVGPDYTTYLQEVEQLPGLSFISFDIFSAANQAATQSYLAQYGSGGKDVWIGQAWSTPDGSALNGDPEQDAQWMTSMYGYAESIGASFFIPFYTNDFSSYTWDTVPSDIVANYNLRQPVYFAFQSLAEEYGATRIATALSSPTVEVGGSVFDSATLLGTTETAGGTVTYSYYLGGSCGGTAALVSQVEVTDGSVPDSASQAFESAGSYSWNAVYSGDSSNNAAISVCEPLAVQQAIPSISATVTPSGITIGSSASDTATLTGAFLPTGSITFNAYSDPACSALVFTSSASLNGGMATSGAFTPASAGTYYWEASYPGDGNNSPASTSCQGAGGTLVVSLRTTTTGLSCSPASVTLNVETACTATVTDTDSGAAVTPSGSVEFSASGAGSFSPSSCSVNGAGAVATCLVSYAPGPGSGGSQTITANYAGDNNHMASAAEFTVTVEERSTSTTLSCSSPVHVHKQTRCTVTVVDTSPGTPITPGGTVTFSSGSGKFSSSSCALSGSGTTASCSVAFKPDVKGTYTMTATYGGDASHDGGAASSVFQVR